MRQLQTASDVIDALGGTAATARLTGRRYDTAVSNWRATGRLPPDTFVVITKALKDRDKTAPLSLWGMKEPEDAPAKESEGAS
jgi:hypothetical protein